MLRIKVDARRGISCARTMQKEAKREMRNGLNRAARAARTAFIGMLPDELRLAKRSMVVAKGGSTSDFVAAREDRLKTYFTPLRKSFNLAQVIGVKAGKDGVTAQHNVVSGGGSANLKAPHAFKAKRAGRGMIFNRIEFREGKRLKQSPKGTHNPNSLHRKGVRAMRTTTPAAVMSQTDNPLRKKWETTAADRLSVEVVEAVKIAAEKSGFAGAAQ